MKNAPVYWQWSEHDVITFVGRYCLLNHGFFQMIWLGFKHIIIQINVNKYLCSSCIFNFPFPPLDRNAILHTLQNTKAKNIDKTKEQFSILEHKRYAKKMPFGVFLLGLKVARDEYILILFFSMLHPTLFLKWDPTDVWINAFSKQVSPLWHANTYAQFILDSYVFETYYSSYMTKMDHTMASSL